MKRIWSFIGFMIMGAALQAQSLFDNMNGWVSQQLTSSSGAESYLFLLLGGILASFLPCVYPIYPLTVNFLRNRTSRLGKFSHPLAYYVGLAMMYFSFGIIASLTGGAFNEILRLPLANLTIGILLMLMALATIDYLHLPFFGGQVDSEHSGLGGTFIMGAGAGLLSSACVGPIVVSILVAIASNTETVSVGSTLTAALKMMSFGLGVGVPVLLLGVFGLALPKSGRWMLYFQWLFSILIGYFAYGYLLKGLNGLGFTDQQGVYVFLGAVLTFLAAYHWQAKTKPKQERTATAIYTLGGVIGIMMMLTNALPTGIATTGIVNSVVANNVEQKGDLTWYLNKENAYEKAAETGKLVFVDFHADWCTNCKAFQKKTQTDLALNNALQQPILYKVYDTSPEFEQYRNDPRFPELKVGIPFFLITDAKGNLIYKTSDYTKTDEMILFLASN
jgi:thiol:disulfide interchange protein DsbD